MKFIRFLLAGCACGLLFSVSAVAQDAAADLKTLITKVQEKFRGGEKTAEAFASELAEFDALLAKYPEKTEDTARIAYMKALIYLQILNDEKTGGQLLAAVEADYPGTQSAANAKRTLYQNSPEGKAEAAAKEAARKATLEALVGRSAPELNFTWSTKEGLKKLSDLKGQVVVLDFWATWCGPCIASFPQVREHVAHFAGSPVTVLGVTSLQGSVSNLSTGRVDTKDNPELEYSLMPQFIAEKNVTWDIAFSEEPVFNPDYAIRGIPYVAIVAPDGTVRHAGLHPGKKADDITGKIEAILKEFNLPVPGV